jgi:hypothetical protein
MAAPRASRDALPVSSLDSGGDDCGLVREQRYPDALALVRDYLRSDTGADYGDTERFVCPDYAVGSDESRVVSYLGLESLSANMDTARFLVRSERDGYVRWDSTGGIKNFVSDHAMLLDTFVVIRTDYGWRIAAPRPNDDVSPSAAIGHYQRLDSMSRDSLRIIARKVRAGL